MIRAVSLLLAGLIGGGATSALAGQYAVPAQCQAYLTVQSRGCLVSHYYRCAGDAEGEQWRVDIGAEGPFFRSKIDAEAQWLISEDLIAGYTLHLDPEKPDPASLTALFANGEDRYDFSRSLNEFSVLRVQGFDRLTGARVTIDGVELEETAFEYRETGPNGGVISAARGHEYVHRDWRLFFSGRYETEDGPVDRSPARFDMPGDKGFLSDAAEYDCTGQMAGGVTQTPPAGGLVAPVTLPLSASAIRVSASPKE